jgi:hypothetical protein
VSDSNVCYRRDALNEIADKWRQQYQETIVHGELARRGHELRLTPEAVVWQGRSGLTWSEALRERTVWGRSYAGSRVAGTSLVRRLALAVLTPVLPFVLTLRYLRGARARGRHGSRTFAAAIPVFLLSLWWSAGELTGYLTGRPR